MSFVKIAHKNIPDYISTYKSNLRQYEKDFELIENDIVEVDCSIKRKKYDLWDRFSNLNECLSIEILNLCKINSFLVDKDIHKDELFFDTSTCSSILKKCEEMLDINSLKIFSEQNFVNEELKSDINSRKSLFEENVVKEKLKFESKPKTVVINVSLVHSRQTKNPFILGIMQPGSRNLCNGCRRNIHLKNRYLRHLEEYPTGSKILISHSYHIDRQCLCSRGFQDNYLSNISVICEVELDNTITKNLLDIGFTESNIQMKDDSDGDTDESETTSQHSGASKEPSSTEYYILKRPRPINVKKRLVCNGCHEVIELDSYLSRGNNIEQSFHIKKTCINTEYIDFSRVKCKVYKLLQDRAELTGLLSCGFYYKNIIGFKPRHPTFKKKIPTPRLRQLSFKKPIFEDLFFLFNDEPFGCEKLVFGERCQGCYQFVSKEELVLRHKEKVPRDKITETPLISQFYHCTKQCLLDRGFTVEYLGKSLCNVVVNGHDNILKVKNMLVKCGFSGDKVALSRTFENSSLERIGPSTGCPRNPFQRKRPKFRVDYSDNHIGACSVCGKYVPSGEYVLIMTEATKCDSLASKIMHLSADCVNACGCSLDIIAQSELSLTVPLTLVARLQLEICGFENIGEQ